MLATNSAKQKTWRAINPKAVGYAKKNTPEEREKAQIAESIPGDRTTTALVPEVVPTPGSGAANDGTASDNLQEYFAAVLAPA